MKKRVIIFSVLLIILITSVAFAKKPPPEPDYECYIWYVDNACYVNYVGGWNMDEQGGPYADPDGDYATNYYECLWSLNYNNPDTDYDSYYDHIFMGPSSPPYDPDWCAGNNGGKIDPRTIGFWKNALNHYTESQIEALLRCVNYHSNVFEGIDTYDQFIDILRDNKNMFEAQLMALWLNICSNRVCPNCGTNTEISSIATVIEIINYCEYLYLNYGAEEAIEMCKDVFDYLNNDIGYDDIMHGQQCYICPEYSIIDTSASMMTGRVVEDSVETADEPIKGNRKKDSSLWDSFVGWISGIF